MEDVVVPVIDTGFWQGRRVFLTGHTGFKGGWLSLWLQALGAQVTGFALEPQALSFFRLAGVEAGMHSLLGDVRDGAALQEALKGSGAEVLIHLAAQPLVRQGYADPVETYATNLMGTVHLLQAVRSTPSVRAVVIVTTDKCYENREWAEGYRENDLLGGRDPYSNSKACAELAAQSFRDSFFPNARYGDHGVAIATARAGNVIGGGDWAADRLVPDFLRAAQGGTALELRHPDAVRPWQHVLEPLAGYLRLAQQLMERGPLVSGAWNFGPNGDGLQTVGEVVRQLASQWPAHVKVLCSGGDPSQHETSVLRLDSSKARTQLGWQPRWNLERALSRTADWHLAHLAGHCMGTVTREQIDQYTRAAATLPTVAPGFHATDIPDFS